MGAAGGFVSSLSAMRPARPSRSSATSKALSAKAETALAKLIADIERWQILTKHVGSLGDLLGRWLEGAAPGQVGIHRP